MTLDYVTGQLLLPLLSHSRPLYQHRILAGLLYIASVLYKESVASHFKTPISESKTIAHDVTEVKSISS